MSTPVPPAHAQPSMANAIRMVRVLGVVSLLCGVFIAGAHVSTLNRIRHNQEVIMRESVAELLPGVTRQVIYGVEPSGGIKILPGIEQEGTRFFAGYDASGKFLGVVIEASGRGYADVISAMYSYSPDMKSITGFKVIDMKETPGLGSRIGTDPDFQANFKALDASLAHPITVVKHGTKKSPWEIDAISGATISSRAVGRMLEASVSQMAPVITRNLNRIEQGN
jgi:electron transport complex protein RnfG